MLNRGQHGFRARTDAFRYLAGPPISIDDLKTLAETNSLAPARLTRDPELVARLIQTIRIGLDRHRFPWVADKREPTTSEREAAVVASAALMATQMVATSRRNEAKQDQEELVRKALRAYRLRELPGPAHGIPTLHHAPEPGSFHPNETLLGPKKADLIVRLWDGRIMPIECKVSNSSTNSIKRLNGDAAVKAHEWLNDFGKTQVVPVAVLSGVYKLRNLIDAQDRGLTLYWAHRLDDLTIWIESTR
jgi:type II secretory pathway pseudopilin PulG